MKSVSLQINKENSSFYDYVILTLGGFLRTFKSILFANAGEKYASESSFDTLI